MKKIFILLLCLIPFALFGQKTYVRTVVSGTDIRFYSGITLLDIYGAVMIKDSLDGSGNNYYVTPAQLTAALVGDYVQIADTAAMLTKYARKASPTFTGLVTGTFSGDITGTASAVTGFIPASGSLTLAGADPITFTTTNITSLVLPTSGTLATLQNINDSLDVYFGSAEMGLAAADSAGTAGDAPKYATEYDLQNASADSSIYVTVTRLTDSLNVLRGEIDELSLLVEDLIAATEGIGVDITAPRFESAELGSFADDTLLVIMDNDDIHQDSIPPLSSFSLTEDGVTFGLDEILIGHDTVFIVLDSAGMAGKTYLLDYTKPTAINTKALQDSTEHKTNSWIDKAVTNNFELVTSIDVWGTGGATTITVFEGTLQMLKKTLPTNASDTTVIWSVINGTGEATIDQDGLLTAVADGDGTVNARATANDGSAIYGQEEITLSNQSAPASYSDTFEAYSEGNLAGQGNWVAGLNNIRVDDVSGNKMIAPYNDNPCAVIYNDTFANDQYASVTIGNMTSISGRIGIGVRMSGSGATFDGYLFYTDLGMSYLMRIDDGSATLLANGSPDNMLVNDVFRLEVEGSTITVLYNGSPATWISSDGVVTDATYSSGRAGVSSAFGDTPWNGIATSWAGGDL